MPELSFSSDALLETYNPDFAFGYGSGVFRQAGYKEDSVPMVDIVLGAENTEEWHKQNIERNPGDYSWVGTYFHKHIQDMGAEIYYHPYVDFDGVSLKYGISSLESIKKDLEEWTYLYVAGRMHKPVHYLRANANLSDAVQKNLEHALRVALCFLPEKFTKQELFYAIAGLSYTGDSRMKGFENGDKVANIVSKNMEGFEKLYQRVISESGEVHVVDGEITQGLDSDILERRFSEFPKNVQARMITPESDIEIFRDSLRMAIAHIVNGPSKYQTVKGLLTAGVQRSVRYALEKRAKAKK